MLDDPRVNFAISALPGRAVGISHLGIQAEDEAELAEVYQRLMRAERPRVEEQGTTCCYARSDKQWIADPQGVPWETFFTYGEAPVYRESSLNKLKEAITERAVCCEPTSIEPTAATQTENCCALPAAASRACREPCPASPRPGPLRGADARVASVYAWFTEGFDTSDLKGAKTLLEELGAA
jgi:hypothetical protein